MSFENDEEELDEISEPQMSNQLDPKCQAEPPAPVRRSPEKHTAHIDQPAPVRRSQRQKKAPARLLDYVPK